MSDWDSNKQKNMTFNTVIKGVPFIDSTRSTAIFNVKVKSNKFAVVEIESETLDLP